MRWRSRSLLAACSPSRKNHGGVRSSLAQTRQWPTTWRRCAAANSTSASASVKLNLPSARCTGSGFRQFSADTELNCAVSNGQSAGRDAMPLLTATPTGNKPAAASFNEPGEPESAPKACRAKHSVVAGRTKRSCRAETRWDPRSMGTHGSSRTQRVEMMDQCPLPVQEAHVPCFRPTWHLIL